MTGVLAAALAGYGAFLLYTALVLGWRGLGPAPVRRTRSRRPARRPAREVVAAGAAVGLLAAALAYVAFGGALPALTVGVFAAGAPFAAARGRRQRRRAAAAEAWPRLLEELRLLTGSAGRSIPQALFEVGRRAPAELRPAFALAEREWLLTTDFERTAGVLKAELADPTADVICETLVVAQEVGGGGLDRRLGELVEDRVVDQQGRKDAASKQAGVRFARAFVLLVPLGMGLAGLSIGTGRAAYATPGGQVAVAVGVMFVVGCWLWSGRLLAMPTEPRVFADGAAPATAVRS